MARSKAIDQSGNRPRPAGSLFGIIAGLILFFGLRFVTAVFPDSWGSWRWIAVTAIVLTAARAIRKTTRFGVSRSLAKERNQRKRPSSYGGTLSDRESWVSCAVAFTGSLFISVAVSLCFSFTDGNWVGRTFGSLGFIMLYISLEKATIWFMRRKKSRPKTVTKRRRSMAQK